MSSQNTVKNYLECFEAISDEEFTKNVTESIPSFGRNTFLNVLEKGLNCIINDMINSNQQNENDLHITLQLKSLTNKFISRNHQRETTINIFDAFNEDTITVLCALLSIRDQINLKQASKEINKQIKRIDITKHEWIEFNYDISVGKICRMLKHVHPILFRKAFDKIKITGITEYNFQDYYKLMPHLNELNLFERGIDDNPQQKKDQFFEEMGVWFFIISNLCKNDGIFITPKLCPKHSINVFMLQLNHHFTEHNPCNDWKISKNYVPRSIIFQCYDGSSATINDIDFYLEKIEESLDSMKNLLSHENIERLIIARKYKICDDKLYDIFTERAVVVYGPAFNVDNKFVTLKKGNDHYTIYLKFTKTLIENCVSRYTDDDLFDDLI